MLRLLLFLLLLNVGSGLYFDYCTSPLISSGENKVVVFTCLEEFDHSSYLTQLAESDETEDDFSTLVSSEFHHLLDRSVLRLFIFAKTRLGSSWRFLAYLSLFINSPPL